MMTKRHLTLATLVVFILSIIGMSLWLFEIHEMKGWYGLTWLNGNLYSPYITALIGSLAFIAPFLIVKQITIKKTIPALIILYAVNILCYEIGKQLCYALYCRFCFITPQDVFVISLMAFFLTAGIGVAYGFVATKFIKKNKRINMLYITLLVMLTIPLSLVMINVIKGFGTGTDWVDAVKMGYPIFWTTLLFGFSGIMIAKQKNFSMLLKEQLISKFQLLPHPEGGYYKETYRSSEIIKVDSGNFPDQRNYSTAIYFLIEKDNFSALHRIKSDEVWHFYDGDALEVIEIDLSGSLIKTEVGRDISKGQIYQYTVKAGHWFGSRVLSGGKFSFVGCTVAPGFDFKDFEMAKREELCKLFPQHQQVISELTR